jgi:acetate kinase
LTRVLVVNAGSSSLKVSVVETGTREPQASAKADWGSDAPDAADRARVLQRALDELGAMDLDVVAHRVVHGGSRFVQPVPVDDDVLAQLDELSDLAPLHNPIAIDTVRAQRRLLPDLPAVAVFDTAFHATLPEAAYTYALPIAWRDGWGIRRFGFLGLSVEWSVRRAAELMDRPPADLSLVVAHLGGGSSITAVHGGASVATSMGFTPLEGIVMATRSGSVDPGILVYAQRIHGLDVDELERTLDHDSGLLGVSGISGDMRELLAAADDGHAAARLAIDVFVLRAAEGIAAAASNMPALDGLVFTGGIGENASEIRSAICARLSVLGIPPLGDDNGHAEGDAILAVNDQTAVLRIAAREDIVMAEAAAALIG